jgi:cell wall assembly regulator SMI1
MWSNLMENEELWERLEQQLSIHAPKLLASLQPGVSEDTLLEFENQMGQKLPEDIRFAYLRHDGCSYSDLDALGLFNSCRWLPIKESIEEWNAVCESIDGLSTAEVCSFDETDPLWSEVAIRPFTLHPAQWIPFGEGSGRPIFIDLLPGDSGHIGQIIGKYIPGGSGDTWVIAKSFNNHLHDLLLALEQGLLEPMSHVGTSTEYWGYKKTKEVFKSRSYLSVYPLG